MNDAGSRFRTEPEPLLAFRAPRKVSPSGLLNPPGRWRTLLTFGLVMLVLAGSAFATAFLVYQQNAALRVREQLQHLLQKAELDEPDSYRHLIAILKTHADLLGREETGERIARYVLHLALSHGDASALAHASEARSLAETQSRQKGQYYKKVFDIARLLVEKKYDLAQLEAEKALIGFPRSDMLLYELALARLHLGAWDAADATLEMAALLGKPSRIPILVERATLQRRRGNSEQALQLLDEILRLSPQHPIALLEKQLCLAAAGKDCAPPASEDGLPSVVARNSLLHALCARRRGDFAAMQEACSRIPDTEPESVWCRANAYFLGPMDAREFTRLIPELEIFPFPDVPCLIADFHLAGFRTKVARPYMEACRKNLPAETNAHDVRRLAAAIPDRDETVLAEICQNARTPDVLWKCLDAASQLNRWDLVRPLAASPSLPAADREWLDALFFTDAFGLATTLQPPRDCTNRGILLRRLWAAAALLAGRETDAVSWTQLSEDACPNSLQHHLLHLETLLAAGHDAAAMERLDALGEIEHPEGMYRAGRAALKLGRPRAAGYWAGALKRRFPDDFRGFLLSAQIDLAMDQWKTFQENFESARRLASTHPDVAELAAVWEIHQGRIAAVESILQGLSAPDAPEAWLRMARRIQAENPPIAAKWRLTAIRMWKERQSPAAASRVWVEHIRYLDPVLEREEIRRAAETLRQMPQLHPAACMFLARHLHAENRENPEVLAYMEKAVALAPDNPEYRLLYGKQLAARNPAAAAEQFRRVLSMRPSACSEEARALLLSISPEKP